ncbi:MAG: hypothetical protein HUN05_14280 [Desulfobacter sp.]|nr:MAG: hypothetical protein HUN05_14280 [Desulfobacter sp.]
MKARLIRVEESDQGTLGVLVLDGQAFCCTLEPPNIGNRQNLSCIPCGHYTAIRKIGNVQNSVSRFRFPDLSRRQRK